MEDSQVAAALSAQLAERIGRKRFELWFTSQAQLCVEDLSLTIRAASTFVRDWLRAYFADEIRACWEAMVGEAGTVEFEIDAGTTVSSALQSPKAPQPPQPQETSTVTAELASLADPPDRRRNAGLAGFVVGASNEYAFRSAELTARGRQQASPLLFCGPPGVGKTHLLRAILHEYRRHQGGAAALYLTAEQFTSGFVEALRGSGIPSFRHKCRGAKLLAIDDLQFFPGGWPTSRAGE
jgi:chromosomal replication initiator protein